MKKSTLILMRHGEAVLPDADAHDAGASSGDAARQLTEFGKLQVQNVTQQLITQVLHDEDAVVIVSSPLRRAVQTAAVVQQTLADPKNKIMLERNYTLKELSYEYTAEETLAALETERSASAIGDIFIAVTHQPLISFLSELCQERIDFSENLPPTERTYEFGTASALSLQFDTAFTEKRGKVRAFYEPLQS